MVIKVYQGDLDPYKETEKQWKSLSKEERLVAFRSAGIRDEQWSQRKWKDLPFPLQMMVHEGIKHFQKKS